MFKRFKFILLTIIGVVLFLFFYVATRLYPDFLWFNSFGFDRLWWFVFKAKWVVFSLFFVIALSWLWIHFRLSKRYSEQTSADTPLEFNTPFAVLNQLLSQLRQSSQTSSVMQLPARVYNALLTLAVGVGALLFALVAKANWDTIYAHFYQVAYGVSDPILGKDVSFYMFSLPFFKQIQGWFLALFVVTLVFVCWVYFTKNILIFIFSRQQQHVPIKRHVLVLVSCVFLMVGIGAWLGVYDLLFSTRGVVAGPGYVDYHFILPVSKFLAGLWVAEALLVLVWAFWPGFKAPLYGFALIFLVYIVGLRLVPSIVQNYVVAPNEMVKETPYIVNSISYTRMAYGLDKAKAQNFPVKTTLSTDSILNNQTTIRNVRLWNQEPLKQTFSQLQEIRLYYEFDNVDVDRYVIDGSMEQVMLSPREMDISQLTQQAQTWINRHLVYTHGYGVCMTPVSEITDEGLPKFYIKDLPPVSDLSFDVTRPEIYFGEKTLEYVIVNTKQEEFDYPRGDKNVYANYSGRGGIAIDSLLKRLVFSLKYSDIKIFLSSLITSDSRLIFDRMIRQVTRKLTPFLAFDGDPYLVLTPEGRMIWVQDGYTFSNRFPYSDPYKGGVNYIRNSVKVTIDAYSGETHYYVVDKQDPIIQTYQRMYPDLFDSFEEMPVSLKEHMRYPKDLFTVQAVMYSTYHMTDPRVFYNREDLWDIPQETYGESEQTMKAYYMVTKLPGDKKESFILMLPFTPTNKHNMIAWMSVKCDVDSYGDLVVYKFPKERMIYGPMQIESRIDQDTEISQKLTLWGQMGSRVIRGNLMVVPVEESLIYVEPIYLQATQSKLPELKRVIFSYDDDIVMARNLPLAIEEVFGDLSSLTPAEPVKGTVDTIVSESDIMVEILKMFQLFKQETQQKLQGLEGLINKLRQSVK